MGDITVYDSTLRDGAQSEGINFSADDKLAIALKLDELGIRYIEGGYPFSNEKEIAFFKEVRRKPLKTARIVAFGTTRRARLGVEEDPASPPSSLRGRRWRRSWERVGTSTSARCSGLRLTRMSR